MTNILIFKEALRKMYAKNSMYIKPVIRFAITLFTLLIINHYTGYAGMLNHPVVAIIVSAVCALLPVGIIVVLTSLVTILNIYYISSEMAIISMIIYLVMYIFYFRFSSRYGYLMLLVQILLLLRIPYVIPLIVGIALNPAGIVSMLFGVLVFYMLKGAGNTGLGIENGTIGSGVDGASSFLRNLLQNKEMITIIVAFTIAALIVYGIKRLSVEYASTIAIITGGAMELAIIVVCAYIMELRGFTPIWLTGILGILSIVLMYFGQYFILAVNYAGTEYVQFEDDDYYYYVKAVPKVKVNATDIKVRHMNS